MKKAVHFLNQFSEKLHHVEASKVFRFFITVWVLFTSLRLLPVANMLWMTDLLIPLPELSSSNLYNLLFLNFNFYDPGVLYFLMLSIQVLAGLGGLFTRYKKTCAIFLLFSTLNLSNRIHVTLDGGNNLIHLLLFYLCFVTESPSQIPWVGKFQIAFSNLAMIMIRLQVCVVYLTAGLLKISGSLWPKGVALYYTLSLPEFAPDFVMEFVRYNAEWSVLANYFTLAFQISFPFLVWNQRLRPFYILAGKMIHLQIALVMGLFSFGMALVVGYFAFITEEQAQKILKINSRILNKLGNSVQNFKIAIPITPVSKKQEKGV